MRRSARSTRSRLLTQAERRRSPHGAGRERPFELLRSHSTSSEPRYYAFDLLWLNGIDLPPLAIQKRPGAAGDSGGLAKQETL